MATAFTADNRDTVISLNGDGPFIATRIEMTETVSEGSYLKADFVTDKTFDNKVLGQQVHIVHKTNDNKEQIDIFLLASSIAYCGKSIDKDLNHYEVIAQDPLSLMKNASGYKIFQQKTTKEIIEAIFTECGLNKYIKFSVSGTGKKHEYCTEFNETHYDFVRRLCAAEGWHFHSVHKSDVQLVIADTNQAFESFKNKNISYLNPTSDVADVVLNWSAQQLLGTNAIDMMDFSMQNAQTFNGTEKSTITQSLNLGMVSYGNGAVDKSEISSIGKAIQSASDVQKNIFTAKTSVKELFCGNTFTLKNHPQKDFNQEYAVIGISVLLIAEESGMASTFESTIQCIPSKTVFKPLFQRKPCFSGILTATVTGPSDKEIYTDDKGRIKVLMHFDREGKKDENSSIWIPSAQMYTGNGFGSMFLPRNGTTVIVSFINGDIDRPIAISSIYTDDQKLPFEKSSQSGIKTHSHPNGAQKDCNELRFEDQKDAEEIYIHAQKDFKSEIENDVTTSIKGNETVNIEKKLTTTVKEDVSHSTEKTYTLVSKEKMSVSTDADSETTVKGNMTQKVDGDISTETQKNAKLKAQSDITVDGKNITITGQSNITLKVGGSKIEITSSGIEISATKVTVKGTTTNIEATNLSEKGSAAVKVEGANISIKANANAELSGLMTNVKASTMATVEGSAMLTLKGGLTRIN